MRLDLLSLFVIYFVSDRVKGENDGKGQVSVHAHIEHYSGYVNTRAAYMSFKTRAVYECISGCLINATFSFYFLPSEQLCYCYEEKLDLAFNTVTEDTGPVYGFYLFEYPMIATSPRDCLSLFEKGFVEDGVYLIYPTLGAGVNVWCDMTNGGWTVIQRREDGTLDFYRPWNDYVKGFGNATGELWLGLENIYRLTQSPSALEIKMETFGDVTPATAFAYYSSFSIDDVTTDYTMHVDDFTGDCGDSFSDHNGFPFTTKDRDNDSYRSGNCAVKYEGAWWYLSCHWSNLNGLYLSGSHNTFANGVNWHSCWGHNYSLKTVVMKIKRT